MHDVYALLQRGTDAELALLSQILESPSREPAALIEALQVKSCSFLSYRILGKRPSYQEIVQWVAEKMDIRPSCLTAVELEPAITERLFRSLWEKMSPAQRQAFDEQLAELASKVGRSSGWKGIALTGAGLLAAKASGFGVYLLASSVLGALTSSIGVALPFYAYMAMASTISVILGPAVLAGLVLSALHKLTGPDLRRVTTAIIAIHTIRARTEKENNDAAARLKFRQWLMTAGAAVAFAALLALFLAR